MSGILGRKLAPGMTFCLILSSAFGQSEPGTTVRVKLKLEPGQRCVTALRYPSLEQFLATNPLAKELKMPPTIRKRTLSFSGIDVNLISEFSDGSSTSEFIRGGYYLGLSSQTGVRIQPLEEDGGLELDFRSRPYPELNWIDETKNAGLQTVKGKKFVVYEEKGATPAFDKRLYVDPTTGFPVLLESPEQMCIYSYTTDVPIGKKIPMPEQLAADWARARADTKRYLGKVIAE